MQETIKIEKLKPNFFFSNLELSTIISSIGFAVSLAFYFRVKEEENSNKEKKNN